MGIPTQEALLNALQQRHGAQLQEKLSSSTVAICGLGGLGSHVSNALARAGVGRLILLDFDSVDVSNLHRQQYQADQIGQPKALACADNLRAIAPYVELEPHVVRLTEGNLPALLSSAKIICECFDNAEQKAMLVNTVLETMPDKYLVAASGMAGLDSGNLIQTRQISRRFWLCGDGVSEVREGEGLFCARVMLCAAHQALTVLNIIAGNIEF